MQANLEDIVSALHRRCNRTSDCLLPSNVYGIGLDLTKAISVSEQHSQFMRLLSMFECNKEECTVYHVVSLCSLVCGSNVVEVGGEYIKRWESVMHSILTAHTPFSKSIVSAVCFCLAEAAVKGLSVVLVRMAGASLQGGDASTEFPVETAMELLACCADALVSIRNNQKHQEQIEGNKKEKEEEMVNIIQHELMLKDMLICFAIDILFCIHGDELITSFLSRRVLIPLMLSGGQESLAGYHSRIQDLLQTFSADKSKQAEVIVLIAALFEYVFRYTDGNKERDYRCSSYLWESLRTGFWEAVTCERNAGHRANMQLRAEYLLKRIVDLTHEQQLKEGWEKVVCFNPYFVWVPNGSHVQWGLFFLVLEATNEYGLHIIQPALPKLDALVKQLSCDIEVWKELGNNNNNNNENWKIENISCSGGLHPIWIEFLFLKMLLHPNMAIRKIVLHRVWSLDTSVLQLFSSVFLFTNVLETAIDSRLCTELDRTPLIASFLDTKSFEGPELRALTGPAGPLADQLEKFYTRVFCDVLQTADTRKEAMRRLLHCVSVRPSRHGATMLLRILHGIAEGLASEKNDKASRNATWEMITDSGVLQELFLVLRDAVHDNMSFWLDVRLSAITFNALLYFASINPVEVRKCSEFWKLFCMCGPLGYSVGNSAVTLDSLGHVGSIGTCIDPFFLNDQLVRFSRMNQTEQNKFYYFLRSLLHSDSLLADVQLFLRSTYVDEVQGKQLLFLSGALDMAEAEDREVLTHVAREITTTLLSFSKRSYISHASLFAALVAFVEFHHSVGTVACKRYYSLTTVIELSETIYTLALSSLRQATQAIINIQTSDALLDDLWVLQHTAKWDAVVAAVVSAEQIAVSHDPYGASHKLHSQQRIDELVHLLLSTSNMCVSSSSLDATNIVAQHFAAMVVARNTSRLLQGVICGLIELNKSTTNLQDAESNNVNCHCYFDAAFPPCWIDQLTHCPSLRLTSSDIPCGLTNLSWTTLLAQYQGGIYNVIFVLCNTLDPSLSPELLVTLQEYGLDQIDRCWGTTLTSVYDILAWVAAATTSTNTVNINLDYTRIVTAMFQHIADVGAREYARVSVLAFNALLNGTDEHEALVKSYISKTLLNETDSDRSAYVAAVTVSAEVMRDPIMNWMRFKELLLHMAVLYNNSREEEPSETLVAITEPLMLLWSETLRAQYPPTVRIASVGRAFAISVILWCCYLRREWAVELSLELLEWNLNHTALVGDACKPNSKPHRSRIRLWQLLCALLPMIEGVNDLRKIVEKVILKCLPITNLGSVRRLMELYTLKIMERQPILYTIIDSAMMNYDLRPQVCGSYLLVMSHMILQQLRGEVEPVDGLINTLLHRLFQQSTSHQHLLRIICHIGLYHIYNVCTEKGVTFPPTEKMIFDYIGRAPEHAKFRAKHSEQLFFSLSEASTPRQLFCIQRRESANILMESIPAVAFERMRFIDRELRCLIGARNSLEMLRVQFITQRINGHHVLEPFKDFPYIPHTESNAAYCIDYTAEAMALLLSDANNAANPTTNNNNNNNNIAGSGSGDDNIQRKVTPWWNSQIYNELHPRSLQTERQPVIVIGSLLQNPVNIAGLFRCGEIFAMEKVVVPDASVFEHPHFIAAARSAELWLPWEVVPARNLPTYLGSLRQEGYTLIGIEQTASSVSMACYQFPKRAVIILGAEGHGVPAQLLPLLDVCVEIPQFGLIRSLNVHVTGSIVMYEYTRQHLMNKTN
ncbi:tRNA/rRNA methyltransferase [Trypanosoma melophagium]|uniref:tRNA/rRNA methyltransferase n=1 Tax=Trypanosoma melophagium TaxID=715481 RepID=UPI00351A0A4E|nr:tRNA/rRNA methyltransferase [Trypanosoma melophagium]